MLKGKLKQVFVIVIILIVAFLGMSFLSNSEIETQKRDTKPKIRVVNTQKVEFGIHDLNVLGNGTIASQKVLDVTSEVSGKIEYAKNNLKNGSFVKKGELVVQVDSREIENNLYSLRSDFMNSVASILPDLKVESDDLYNKWFKYFSKIDIHKNIPRLPEISNLQEKIKLSSRKVFTKYYSVKNQEILLSKYSIRAPFRGYLKSKGVIKNSFVSRGQSLFTLEDVFNLEIAVPLLVNEYNQIKFGNGTDVIISSDNSKNTLTGKLVRKDPQLNRNSQSLNVYVAFSNSKMYPEFLAGNYVNVSIKGRELQNVAKIPRHLIVNDSFIYTIEDGKLAKDKVKVVEMQNDKVIIENNFEDELELVTTILQKPLIGMLVKSSDDVAEENTRKDDDSIAVK